MLEIFHRRFLSLGVNESVSITQPRAQVHSADEYCIVAKVNNGTIKGKGLNGTIEGGVSVIDLFSNGQVIVNNVRSIGTTAEGLPFLIDENGVGSPADDFARLVSIYFGHI